MPRAGLRRDAVIDLAVDVVDTGGFASLTLAAVAARAGVAVPSLYKHVDSLSDLRLGVAEVAIRELARRSAAATVGVSGPDAVRALGHAIRSFAREHPGLYAATQVAPDPEDPQAVAVGRQAGDLVAVVAAVLRGFGIPDGRTVDAVRTVRSAIHGFVQLEQHGGFAMPDDLDQSFETLLDVQVAGLSALARR